MKLGYLLDTHALLWWLAEPGLLSAAARSVLESDASAVYVSAVSSWEIATKVRLGKLEMAQTLLDRLPEILAGQGFMDLPISVHHGLRAGSYTQRHRDPFDRLLAAQAELNQLVLISVDPQLTAFPCQTLW